MGEMQKALLYSKTNKNVYRMIMMELQNYHLATTTVFQASIINKC